MLRIKIKNIIAQALGIEPSDILEETLLRQDLNIESTDLIDILEDIEKELGIKVPPDTISEVKTVEEFSDLVEQYAQEEI